MGFLSPSVPSMPEVPKTPERSDAEIRQAEADERKRIRNRRGRGSTIMTSGQGVAEAATVAKKELLGQ